MYEAVKGYQYEYFIQRKANNGLVSILLNEVLYPL